MLSTITYNCGHQEVVQVYGSAAQREQTIKSYSYRDCRDCQNKAAAEASAHLPQLIGSEKQIAWANTIRLEKTKTINERLAENKAYIDNLADNIKKAIEAGNDPEKVHEYAAKMEKEVREKIAKYEAQLNETSASWWINNR